MLLGTLRSMLVVALVRRLVLAVVRALARACLERTRRTRLHRDEREDDGQHESDASRERGHSGKSLHGARGGVNQARAARSCVLAFAMAEGVVVLLRTLGLFVATALAEIIGCYLPYLWLRKGGGPWLLLPAALALATFAWLLTLHPTGAGRTYAAYGGVYIACAIGWIWAVEKQSPDRWDVIGGAICIVGMAVIVLGPRSG